MSPRTPAADAYQAHSRYWADTGGDITVPVDPYQMADAMGVRVYRAVMGPGQSGTLDMHAPGGPVIYVNEAHSANRNRFTVAHELGHYYDAVQRGIAGSYMRDELAASGMDPDEIYANRFAAALLMPKGAVQQLHSSGLTNWEMSRRFNVSEDAMALRLHNLGFA